jgi:hypothetical protein
VARLAVEYCNVEVIIIIGSKMSMAVLVLAVVYTRNHHQQQNVHGSACADSSLHKKSIKHQSRRLDGVSSARQSSQRLHACRKRVAHLVRPCAL